MSTTQAGDPRSPFSRQANTLSAPVSVPVNAPAELPDSVLALVRAVHERRLAQVALLYLAGHAPLAFLAGTLLHGVVPVCGLLLGPARLAHAVDDWADLLSRPEGLPALQAALEPQVPAPRATFPAPSSTSQTASRS